MDRERLSPQLFRLPIEKIRAGYKTDVYFNRTRQILKDDRHHPRVTMQLFQKVERAVVCGTDQTLAILHTGTGHYENPALAESLFERFLELERQAYLMWLNLKSTDWEEYQRINREIFDTSKKLSELWVDKFGQLSIKSLHDGDEAAARETVMLLEGDLRNFVHLETVYLGALTQGTCVATNTRNIVEAAGGKPILIFGARHRSLESQAGDGYAAFIGGAKAVSTNEQGEYWGSKGIGTIPHCLIAAYGGNTTIATLKFQEYIDSSVNVVSLVDFDNDSVGTSLAVARALGGGLWGVRLDTSENMIDRSIWEDVQNRNRGADSDTRGVNPRLVWNVREALNTAGFTQVRIIVSGGFNAGKIEKFERLGVPVDSYGVGSAMFEGSDGKYDYTADVVRPTAKVGRAYNPNPRLEELDKEKYIRGLKVEK